MYRVGKTFDSEEPASGSENTGGSVSEPANVTRLITTSSRGLSAPSL